MSRRGSARRRSSMGRVVAGALFVLLGAGFAGAADDAAEAVGDGLWGRPEQTWRGVTAGRVVADPLIARIGGHPVAIVATEDRRVRGYRLDGTVTLDERLGFRAVARTEADSAGVVWFAGADGDRAQLILDGRTRPFITVDTGGDLGIEPIARVWGDDAGNVWLFGVRGGVALVTAAGTFGGTFPTDGALLDLAARDGSAFALFASGELIEVDSHAGARRFGVAPGGASALVAADRDRGPLVLTAGRDAAIWRVSRDGTTTRVADGSPTLRVAGRDGDGGAWLVADDQVALRVDPGGTVRVAVDLPGARLAALAVGERGGLLAATDDPYLVALDDAGTSRAILTIDDVPERAYAASGVAVTSEADWGIVLWRWAPIPREGGGPASWRPPLPTAPNAALDALVDRALGADDASLRADVLRILERRVEGGLIEGLGATRGALTAVALAAARGQTDDAIARRRAIALLAAIGDRLSRAALSTVVAQDPRPSVAAEALRALARYPIDEFGAVARAGLRVPSLPPDDQAVLAEAILVMVATVAPGAGFDAALEAIAAAAVPRRLRERALEARRDLAPVSPTAP